MKKTTSIGTFLVLALFLYACERPQSPDFKLDQKVQAPLLVNKTYQFLGEHNALIDTTTEDYDSLFAVGNDGLIRLSKEKAFDFGDLNDAIPEVDVDPVQISSEVGPVKLNDFSSDGSVGSAGFQDVTGQNPASFPAGQLIPAGSTPGTINIPFTTDYFVSATIKSGNLEIAFINNLGFDISQLNLTLNSGSDPVGSDTFNGVDDAETVVWSIPFSSGTVLKDLNIDFTASWIGQTMQHDPRDLEVNNITGNNLVASQVMAVIGAQQFTTSGVSSVDDNDFRFTQPDHFIQLASGNLKIFNVINDIDLDINELQVSFPDIRHFPYGPGDSLVIDLQVPRNSSNSVSKNVDLKDVRIYAEGNELEYHVTGDTENIKSSDKNARTIKETDTVSASVGISNLAVEKAKGIVVPRNVLLNDDMASNGKNVLDVFNDREAETIEIDGVDNISNQVQGLQFANPLINILYNTNLGIKTSVIASIVGVNSNGKEVYLHGNPESPATYVSSSEIPAELKANGSSLNSDQLIKFNLSTSEDGSIVNGGSRFDSLNTNVSEFLDNLPSQVRFVGIASLNPNSQEGLIVEPVEFEPSMSIDVPLNFAAKTSVYSDTTDADLSDLPGQGDKQRLSEATLTVRYTNNLPLRLNLDLVLLDEQFGEVTSIPLSNDDQELVVVAAPVDPETRFVSQGNEGKFKLSLTGEQLSMLNKTRNMIIRITFNTTRQEEVKLRAEDSISLSIKMNVSVESNIN